MIIVNILLILSVFRTSNSKAPEVLEYNPLNGFKPKSYWNHFAPYNEVSASVADFTSPTNPCVRLVLFTAKGAPMEHVQISCNSPRHFLGLKYIENALWYYGMALVKKIGTVGEEKIGDKATKFMVVKRNDDLLTCTKTYWVVKETSTGTNTAVSDKTEEVRSDVEDGDVDCKNLVQLNIPPMIMLSSHGDVGMFQSVGRPVYFNTFEAVGARTKMYMKGFECFRLLTFYSYGRYLDSLKIACGPMQGVVMTEKAFYYGKTAMIKIHDEDEDMFTLFMNPYNGIRRSTEAKVEEPICIKKIFRLTKTDNRYKRKMVSEIKEYEFDPECKDFVEGRFPGKPTDDTRLNQLIDSLERDKPAVDMENLEKLNGYKLNSKRTDFNLANELGAVILYFQGPKPTDKLKVIVIVTRGTGLIGTVIEADSSNRIVVHEDKLYHDKEIMAKKVSDGKYTVFINTGEGCTKITYELKTSNDKLLKKQTGKDSLDKTDPDCKSFLEGTELKNPEANK